MSPLDMNDDLLRGNETRFFQPKLWLGAYLILFSPIFLLNLLTHITQIVSPEQGGCREESHTQRQRRHFPVINFAASDK